MERYTDVRIGTTRGFRGGREVVYLDLVIRPLERETPRYTIDHALRPADAVEVSITGSSYVARKDGQRDRRYADILSGGQIIDTLREVPGPRAARIAELWDRWHLNGMRANCAHMPAGYVSGMPCAAGLALDGTPSDTPYTSGAAWLYEPVPAEVLDALRTLFTETPA